MAPEQARTDDAGVFDAIETMPGLCAVMTVSSTETLAPFRRIGVYLVNNTDQAYSAVERLTGAFCSMDDDLMETGKRMTDMGGLPAASLAELEPSDTGELDFVVWYFLDMTDQQGNQLQGISNNTPFSHSGLRLSFRSN